MSALVWLPPHHLLVKICMHRLKDVFVTISNAFAAHILKPNYQFHGTFEDVIDHSSNANMVLNLVSSGSYTPTTFDHEVSLCL